MIKKALDTLKALRDMLRESVFRPGNEESPNGVRKSSMILSEAKIIKSPDGVSSVLPSRTLFDSTTINLLVFDANGNLKTITVSSFKTIGFLKKVISNLRNLKNTNYRIESIYFFSQRLDENKRIFEYGLKNNSKLFTKISRKIKSPKKGLKVSVQSFGCVPKQKEILRLIKRVEGGLRRGFIPELSMDGTGGNYFMKDKNKKNCAIFKPFDEEAYAPFNPRMYKSPLGSKAFKPGLISGCGANREVAAYILDRDSFSKVPPTTMVEIKNCAKIFARRIPQSDIRIGSLQKLVDSVDTTQNYGSGRFDTEEVHRLAILDLRIVNLDRNDANVLLNKRNGSDLFDFTPIDHGYSLPNCLSVKWYDWAWLSWPQIKQPFSKESLKYIEEIDIEKDVEHLILLGIETEAIAVFRISNVLLKAAARSGLTLYEIASIILRKESSKPSKLETIVAQAITLYLPISALQQVSSPAYDRRKSFAVHESVFNTNSVTKELIHSKSMQKSVVFATNCFKTQKPTHRSQLSTIFPNRTTCSKCRQHYLETVTVTENQDLRDKHLEHVAGCPQKLLPEQSPSEKYINCECVNFIKKIEKEPKIYLEKTVEPSSFFYNSLKVEEKNKISTKNIQTLNKFDKNDGVIKNCAEKGEKSPSLDDSINSRFQSPGRKVSLMMRISSFHDFKRQPPGRSDNCFCEMREKVDSRGDLLKARMAGGRPQLDLSALELSQSAFERLWQEQYCELTLQQGFIEKVEQFVEIILGKMRRK